MPNQLAKSMHEIAKQNRIAQRGPTNADRIPGACDVDMAAHRVFMAAEGRECICWRPSGVECKTCDTELETCYCEERLYMVRCQKCEKVVLVKSSGPQFAAEEAGHAQ
ncbi:hypothetical protein [uncultured Oscillibacter sp.]|uniref:hypothetical protein n=1 Tax=uncultured Oscillibacter sp. TaxID=876091 RepID=UPI0025E626FE|nr:hypothetical protein [uncultured Oscillibacter sp.]